MAILNTRLGKLLLGMPLPTGFFFFKNCLYAYNYDYLLLQYSTVVLLWYTISSVAPKSSWLDSAISK